MNKIISSIIIISCSMLSFSQEIHTYTYNEYNRLIVVDNATNTKTYQFDIMGNRIATNTTNSIDAGITNPTDGLIIYKDNASTYILTSDLGELRVDGWSNTGNISSIEIYQMTGTSPDTDNDIFLGYAQNANSGSWYRDIDIDPGQTSIYINVRCNYSGCPLSGTNTETRTFTYVKPYTKGDFYLENQNDGNVKITFFPNYGGSTNHDFYYRVYRSETTSTSGGTYIGNWSQSSEIIDSNINEGTEYCYWIDVASDSSGNFKSGLLNDEYRCITTSTLGLENNELSNSIEIYPNPTKSTVQIISKNGLLINDVSIYSIEGRLIKTITKDFHNIDISNFPASIYLFQIKSNKGNITRRIIKK